MRRLFAFSMIGITLLMAGCKDDDLTPIDRGRTNLHIVGAVQDSFNLTFDYFNGDDVVIKDFYFNRNFPLVGYADMEAGGTPDEFGNGKLFLMASKQPFINVTADTLMEPREIELMKDERSTLVLADSLGSMRFLKILDQINYPTDTSAAVRFVNVSNNYSTASLTSLDGAVGISNVSFWNASDFTYVRHGQYLLELRDSNGAVVTSMSLWLGGRSAYSFFTAGNALAYFNN